VEEGGVTATDEPAAGRREQPEVRAVKARSAHATWIKRAVVLAATDIGLYVVWPSLAVVFSSGPQLKTVNPLWGVPIVAAEAASFVCTWALLRLALDVKPWFPIATAQLAGNAFSLRRRASCGGRPPDARRRARGAP